MYLPAIECNNKKLNRGQLLCHDAVISIAWISSDYFESFLLPQLLRGENDAKQSDEFQAIISTGGAIPFNIHTPPMDETFWGVP